MILYGSSFSPFVRKTMVYATERGITLEVKNIARGSTDPDFRKASPLGKMPGFTDGDFAISDSSAIIAYLEAKYPDGALIPSDPEGRARVIWFEEFADTVMTQVVFKCFFHRIVMPLFMKQPGDEALAKEGETVDLPIILNYLEGVAPDAGGFLVGGKLSLADIAVASAFVNYEHAPCAVDKGQYPRTYAWVESVLARASFTPIIEMEKRVIAKAVG
jgi:glutathione S-transferase